MPALSLLATLVDFAGTLVVLTVVVTCLREYVRTGGRPALVDAVRLRLASGLVLSLSFKTGAGLIRTITVGTWHQVLGLLFIIALRFTLGRVLKGQVARSRLLRLPDGGQGR